MSSLSNLNDYLRLHSDELAERILASFPPLYGLDDALSPALSQMLRTPYPAQSLAIMGVAKRWQGVCLTATMCAEMPLPGNTTDNVYTLVCRFDTRLPMFSLTIIAVAQRGSIPLANIFLPWLHTEHHARLKRNFSTQRKETSQIRKVVPCPWYWIIPAHGRPASTTSGRKRH